MVDGLEDTYGEKVDFTLKNWKDDDSVREIEALGFTQDEHGMVIHDGEGAAVWKEPSHFQWKRPDVVEAEVTKVSGGE